ncbi:ABC transporter permease [Methylobacterium nonmethylotrophicum]|uniref:Iron ABC transporter permease n=1 Tax=Methylobacterium nonmethylotrophicum TaxID=1141884 RepID=A0A4Z0NGM2_9HYPH|nr:iron ABC transporter permease [Methylobacterium nonmethylotrophicum]TGD95117.1 iron ABC transporter permease [Methylobacterium nonmethylotrophicum]
MSVLASLRSWTGARRVPLPILRIDLAALAWIGLIGVLVFLVVAPIARLLLASVQSPETGDWTLANYATAFGHLRNWEVLGTSLLYAGGVTAASVVMAVPIAWAVARTDMPAKGLVRALILGAFITPSYLGAIGWILLAGPNAGWLNRVWMSLTGASSGLFNVYSFAGLVFVTALYAFPYVFVFTTDALDRVSTEMEEAASILGASQLRTTLRITLPLVTPAILAGAIVVFLDTVALFGTPAIIALPARIRVMTLQLWQYFEYPVRAEVAAAYSLPLVGITVALFLAQRLILGRKGYVALTGKGGSRALTPLGPWRWVALGYAVLVIGLAVLLPFAALGQAAFSTAWGRGFSLDNLTLQNFVRLAADPNARDTIGHSFGYAAATGCLAVLLALAAAYVVTRRLVPGGFLLSLICMTPLVIPGIVLAIGFYATYSTPPIALYGTAAILVLAFTTRFLPIAYVNALAGLRALNPEMEEAVRILGGTRTRAVTRVVVPLLKKSLIGSWLLVFIPAVRELSTALFLVGPNTRVISVMMLDLSENGSFETLAALGFVLLAATIAIVLLGYRLVGRDFMLRRS